MLCKKAEKTFKSNKFAAKFSKKNVGFKFAPKCWSKVLFPDCLLKDFTKQEKPTKSGKKTLDQRFGAKKIYIFAKFWSKFVTFFAFFQLFCTKNAEICNKRARVSFYPPSIGMRLTLNKSLKPKQQNFYEHFLNRKFKWQNFIAIT